LSNSKLYLREEINMRKLNTMLLAGFAMTSVLYGGSGAWADDDSDQFRARLIGYNEPPSISSTGSGAFRAKLSRSETSFEYELGFQDLAADVTQAHIHLGQRAVNGGITIWLCGTTALPGPAGTPRCGGPRSGMVSRTVTAADVIGPAGQGIAAGDFQQVLRAMRAGVTYANVHSTRNPGGEIRGGDDD
jgi:hypothetical protein